MLLCFRFRVIDIPKQGTFRRAGYRINQDILVQLFSCFTQGVPADCIMGLGARS